MAMMRDGENGVNSFDELVRRSSSFPVPFPTSHNRIASIVSRAGQHCASPDSKAAAEATARRQIEQDARSTRVVVHPAVWRLIQQFLAFKLRYGSEAEKALYRGMDGHDLVARMILKRPLSFLGRFDSTLLRDGSRCSKGPRKLWDEVGTLNCQKRSGPPSICTCSCGAVASARARSSPHLSLWDYLSYDEIQVSSLLCASTPTFFVNSGSRHNKAAPGNAGEFEEHGVYLGLVGPRFQREGRMDDEWIVIRANPEATCLPARSTEPPEAAQARAAMWMRVFGVPEQHWQDTVVPLQESLACSQGPPRSTVSRGKRSRAQQSMTPPTGLPAHVVPLREGELFNVLLYKARVRLTAETLLMEADLRGEAEGRSVYLHVVGLGLGVWQVHVEQRVWYMEVFLEALQSLRLPHVGTVDFSWIKGVTKCGNVSSGSFVECANGNRVRILISERDPAKRLQRGMLLVAVYAWDGNAFPGNEYWMGKLASSGDGAAACCSTIAELQNPLINDYSRNVVVFPLRE